MWQIPLFLATVMEGWYRKLLSLPEVGITKLWQDLHCVEGSLRKRTESEMRELFGKSNLGLKHEICWVFYSPPCTYKHYSPNHASYEGYSSKWCSVRYMFFIITYTLIVVVVEDNVCTNTYADTNHDKTWVQIRPVVWRTSESWQVSF